MCGTAAAKAVCYACDLPLHLPYFVVVVVVVVCHFVCESCLSVMLPVELNGFSGWQPCPPAPWHEQPFCLATLSLRYFFVFLFWVFGSVAS
jgi:hypothetical protein